MLEARHGTAELTSWRRRGEAVEAAREAREERVLAGEESPRYRFDYGVLGDEAVDIDASELRIGNSRVALQMDNPFGDMQA